MPPYPFSSMPASSLSLRVSGIASQYCYALITLCRHIIIRDRFYHYLWFNPRIFGYHYPPFTALRFMPLSTVFGSTRHSSLESAPLPLASRVFVPVTFLFTPVNISVSTFTSLFHRLSSTLLVAPVSMYTLDKVVMPLLWEGISVSRSSSWLSWVCCVSYALVSIAGCSTYPILVVAYCLLPIA